MILFEDSITKIQLIEEPEGNGPVVIKQYKGVKADRSPDQFLRNEFDITRSLKIPGIRKVTAYKKYESKPALYLEYVDGLTLGAYAKNQKPGLEEKLEISCQIVKVLADVHQHKVIHKDIHPGNILIERASGRVFVIDFAIAAFLNLHVENVRDLTHIEGQLPYISPEQTGRTNRSIDYRSDFYSLGVLLYEFLGNQLPFVSDDPMAIIHSHIARTPPALHEVAPEIPEVLAQIVAKLLKKNPEERYQSAWGIYHDLNRCRELIGQGGAMETFPIGREDHSSQFKIPEKLYGREQEIDWLRENFKRINKDRVELVEIKGNAGVGKSSLVRELKKIVAENGGYFISGKFNEYQVNVPYQAFLQAFGALVDGLLTQNRDQMEYWRSLIDAAVGVNGRVLTEVLPNLEIVIGTQPELPELDIVGRQNRFNLTFQNFVKAIATPEHPLVIVLDDMQWADGASIELLKQLIHIEERASFLLICAYRDAEVGELHLFRQALNQLEKIKAPVWQISLRDLKQEDTEKLIADALNRPVEEVRELSGLIFGKTNGNPFFVHEFLKNINKEGLFHYDKNRFTWEWDIQEIRDLHVTDNVVEFLQNKIQELPEPIQESLQVGACIGAGFQIADLSAILDLPVKTLIDTIEPAILEGFIIPQAYYYRILEYDEAEGKEENLGQFKFSHDRIRQAFYGQIAKEELPRVHLKIAQTLNDRVESERSKSHLFEVANHYLQGLEAITQTEERKKAFQIFLEAGLRAKAGAAYLPALNYLKQARSLLPPDSWEAHYESTFQLYLNLCETAFSATRYDDLQAFSDIVLQYSRSPMDRAKVYKVLITSLDGRSQFDDALKVAVRALKDLDLNLKENPGTVDVLANLVKLQVRLIGKSIETLENLPPLTDPRARAQIEILYSTLPISYRAGRPDLYAISVIKSLLISLKHGNAPESFFSYCNLGTILVAGFNNPKAGLKYGELALRMEQRNTDRQWLPPLVSAYHTVQHHFKAPIRAAIPYFRKAIQAAKDAGNPFWTCTHGVNLSRFLLWSGIPLIDLFEESGTASKEAKNANLFGNQYWSEIYRQLAANLMFESATPWKLEGDYFDPVAALPYLIERGEKTIVFAFHFHSFYLAYLFGELDEAIDHVEAALEYESGVLGMMMHIQFSFYYCLVRLQAAQRKPGKSARSLKSVRKYLRKLEKLAAFMPANFSNKMALVKAEWAKLNGEQDEAVKYYEQSIEAARQNGFVHEEALALELAGHFYLASKNESLGEFYLAQAKNTWEDWGAVVKSEQLNKAFPGLGNTEKEDVQSVAHLDLKTVLKASTAISSAIVLEQLLTRLMNILMENAGAEKGVLLEYRDDRLFVAASGRFQEGISIHQDQRYSPGDLLPQSIINYVERSKKELVLDNAGQNEQFAKDPYIQQQRIKSVLCFPILRQDRLMAIIYLENNLTANAFTPERLELLRLLSSQITISLENARLYETLEEKVKERTMEVVEQKEEIERKNGELENTLAKLRSAQGQLVEAEKMASLGQLTAGIAHEMNNPINYLSANVDSLRLNFQDVIELLKKYSELKEKGYSEEMVRAIEAFEQEIDADYVIEETEALLDGMEDGAQRTSKIVLGLRNFSRLDEDDYKFVDIHEGIDSTLTLLSNKLGNRIQVHKNYGEIPPVECLPGKINQVLMNILNNAIQAIKETGSIFITTRKQDDFVFISIRDTGQGIPEKVKNHIFDPFYTTKDVGEGTGLGLSISYGIIEKHHGTIEVKSEVGEGAEFVIRLPQIQTDKR